MTGFNKETVKPGLHKHAYDSLPSIFDTCEEFVCNIAGITSIATSCLVSLGCNDLSHRGITNLYQMSMEKQELETPMCES